MRDCAQPGGAKACTAALIDLNGDGVPEVVVHGRLIAVYTLKAGAWTVVNMQSYVDDGTAGAFDSGHVATAAHRWSDLKIGDTTITIDAK